MLAKGRILGIQFVALLENNLYFDIAERAVHLAMIIKKAFEKKGYQFLYESFSNQLFPILPNEKIERL
jgi:threonine aldolase